MRKFVGRPYGKKGRNRKIRRLRERARMKNARVVGPGLVVIDGPAQVRPITPVAPTHLSGDVKSGVSDPAAATQKLAMAITTAGREFSTLLKALESTRKAGFKGTVHVFAEPDSVSEVTVYRDDSDVVYHRNADKLGCFKNWKSMATWMLEHTTEEWILLMQDDVYWCTHAASILQRGIQTINRDHIGFLSPYTSPAMVPERAWDFKGYWLHAKRRNFWGAVATCFPRENLEYLLNNLIFRNHRHYRMVDVVIGDVFYNRDDHRKPMVHVPSLATHIGKTSTIGRDKNPDSQWARCGHAFNLNFEP